MAELKRYRKSLFVTADGPRPPYLGYLALFFFGVVPILLFTIFIIRMHVPHPDKTQFLSMAPGTPGAQIKKRFGQPDGYEGPNVWFYNSVVSNEYAVVIVDASGNLREVEFDRFP